MAVQINPLRVNLNTCYVIRDRGTIMVEGGPPKKAKAIGELFRRFGILPGEVRLIVLTHGHFDHAGSAKDLKALTGAIVHTPGHTAGSVSVELDSGQAFVGCMAHDGFPFRWSPGLPIFSDNIEQVKESWNRILRRGVKMIYPAHGKPSGVDVVRQFLHERR